MLSSTAGIPRVIRVASLVDEKPFPTLFWLVDPELGYAIDQLEAGGAIARLQQLIDSDQSLQSDMARDHRAHIELRNSYMSKAMVDRLKSLDYFDVLQKRGIGGIEDFGRIRCLHTWYAAHLVVANCVGTLLEPWLSSPQAMV